MQKKRLKKLVLQRDTVRALSNQDARRARGGTDTGDGSGPADSCVVLCGRLHIPGG